MENEPQKPLTKEANARQRALDKLVGHENAPRRPLTGYEYLYEVANDGALFSVRLQRFLKPVINAQRGTAELEFEYQNETIRLSPGKAIAISFFTPEQRIRIADEAYDERAYQHTKDLYKHPSLNRLSRKYDVSESAIYYILYVAIMKRSPQHTQG